MVGGRAPESLSATPTSCYALGWRDGEHILLALERSSVGIGRQVGPARGLSAIAVITEV